MKRQVGLKLEHELVRRVDEARGGVSRAAWIRLALEERLSRMAAVSSSGSGRVLSGPAYVEAYKQAVGIEPAGEPSFAEAYYSSPAVSPVVVPHRPGCSCLVCLGS